MGSVADSYFSQNVNLNFQTFTIRNLLKILKFGLADLK